MALDKKIVRGRLHFVLATGLGATSIVGRRDHEGAERGDEDASDCAARSSFDWTCRVEVLSIHPGGTPCFRASSVMSPMAFRSASIAFFKRSSSATDSQPLLDEHVSLRRIVPVHDVGRQGVDAALHRLRQQLIVIERGPVRRPSAPATMPRRAPPPSPPDARIRLPVSRRQPGTRRRPACHGSRARLIRRLAAVPARPDRSDGAQRRAPSADGAPRDARGRRDSRTARATRPSHPGSQVRSAIETSEVPETPGSAVAPSQTPLQLTP